MSFPHTLDLHLPSHISCTIPFFFWILFRLDLKPIDAYRGRPTMSVLTLLFSSLVILRLAALSA